MAVLLSDLPSVCIATGLAMDEEKEAPDIMPAKMTRQEFNKLQAGEGPVLSRSG